MVHISKQRNYIKLLLKGSKWLGHYGYNVSSEWMISQNNGKVMNRAPEIMEMVYIMEAGDWIVSK